MMTLGVCGMGPESADFRDQFSSQRVEVQRGKNTEAGL